MGLLDLLFPKYCVNCKKMGAFVCDRCFTYISFDPKMICLVCNRASFDGFTHPLCQKRYVIDGVFASVVYGYVVKKLIYRFKYKPFVATLNTFLVDLFYEGLIQQELFYKTLGEKPLLVPIPLHATKLRSRGYNHAALLAEGLAKKLGLSIALPLVRTRATKSQFGLSQKERKANIAGAFALKNEYKKHIKDASILIIDDILTTGATIFEAAKILKQNGAKEVWGVTLARDQ